MSRTKFKMFCKKRNENNKDKSQNENYNIEPCIL